MKARKIIIEIEEDIYQEIKQLIGLKMMMGNVYGSVDEFVIMIVKSIEKGMEQITVIKRKKGQKRTKI